MTSTTDAGLLEDKARARRERRTRWAKRRKLRLLEGTWEPTPFVPVAQARVHLLHLHSQGWSIAALEALLGVPSGGLSPLVYERDREARRHITQRRHEEILGLVLDVDRVPDGCHVPALGSIRRVRALNAVGWSLSAIADRAGVSKQAIASSLARDVITARAARRIRDIYAELEMSQGPSQRTRRHAAAQGWAPPAVWDDIDDPDEEPDPALWREVHDGPGVLTQEALMDCAAWGLTREQTGDRLGVQSDSVDRWLERHDLPELRARFARNETAAA